MNSNNLFSIILKYNLYFRYYLLAILGGMLIIGFFFIIKYNKKLSLSNTMNLFLLDNSSITYENNLDIKYSNILKKILKIINNPIKFDYQINQINQLKISNLNKYNKIKNDLAIILNKKKHFKSKLFYNQIKLIFKKYKILTKSTKIISLLIYINS